MEYKKASRFYNAKWVAYYSKYFYQSYHLFQRFQRLSEDKVEQIWPILQIWRESATFQTCQNMKQKYLKTLFYLNEYTMGDFDEKAYFLIQAIDPDVQVLQMYEISCTMKEAKQNLLQKFGFADLRLARIEQAYAEKFLSPEQWRFEQMDEEQLQDNFFSLERKKKPKS